MPRHTAASCLLSALIVSLVGFALHRPESLAQAGPEGTSPIVRTRPEPPPVPPPPPPTPTGGVAWDPVPPDATGALEPAVRSPSVREESLPAGSPQVKASPFARVRAGETLNDVARRVYGDPAAAALLWEANRDQLTRREGSLPAGTLLRTPR